MRFPDRGRLLAALFAVAFGLRPGGAAAAASTASPDWPMHHHDAARTGFNPGMPASFVPPLSLRWVAQHRNENGFIAPSFSRPVGAGGRLYQPLLRGENLERLFAPTGIVQAVFRHSPGLTWRGPFATGSALALPDRVLWGLAGDRKGVAAIRADFDASTTPLFPSAGPAGGAQVIGSSPAYADGLVVSGDQAGFLFALNAKGAVVWSFQAGAAIQSPPTIAETLGFVYAGAVDGVVHARDLYSGAAKWTFPAGDVLFRAASTDGTRLYVPSPGEGLLYVLDAKTGTLEWVVAEPGPFFAGATPALAGNRVIWRGSDVIMALDPAAHATIWTSPTGTLAGSSAIGNGYVWNAGGGHMEARRLSDGVLVQDKDVPFVAATGDAMLLPDVGGLLVAPADTARVAAFANEALPLAPQGVQITPHDVTISVTWSAPPPAPVDPPPRYYVICRHGQYGAKPLPAGEPGFVQEATINLATGALFLAAPGAKAVATGPDEFPIRLPDNRTDPPSMHAVAVSATSLPLGHEDAACSPGVSYEYEVVTVDEAGAVSPQASGPAAVSIQSHPTGLPGPVGPGADWLQAEFDDRHTGWNPNERIAYSPFVGNISSPENVYHPVFSVGGVAGPVTFTQPVASQGRLYAGASDGRLYAFNSRTGDLLWWLGTGAPIRFPPAVSQSRSSPDYQGLPSLVHTEVVSVASDNGLRYDVTIRPGDQFPRSVSTIALGGPPTCAPTSSAVLSRRSDHTVAWNGVPIQGTSHTTAPVAFLGPDNAMILTYPGGGGIMRAWGGDYPIRSIPGTALTPELVRPSRWPYKTQTGHEELVAGFGDGWFGLISDVPGTTWVPLQESYASPVQLGGIVTPFGLPPELAAILGGGSESFTGSYSIQEVGTGAQAGSVVVHDSDTSQRVRGGCPLGQVYAAELLGVQNGPVFPAFVLKDPQSGVPVSLHNLSLDQFAVTLQAGINKKLVVASATITGQQLSPTPQAETLTSMSLAPFGCNPLFVAPTKLVTGLTDPFGSFAETAGYPLTDDIFSRGMRYSGGSAVSGAAWSAPLAPRAAGRAIVTGGFDRVNLVWSPPPGYPAIGYEIYRGDIVTSGTWTGAPGGITYALLATVPGGDTLSYTDTRFLDAKAAGRVRYYVRAFRAQQPGETAFQYSQDRLGAGSLVVKPETARINAIERSLLPTSIFEEEAMLLTVRVSMSATRTVVEALTTPSVNTDLSDPLDGTASQTETTWVTNIQTVTRPIPGVPVFVHYIRQEGEPLRGRLKRTLDAPGTTDFSETIISDQEGKVQLYFVPDPGSTGNGAYGVRFDGFVHADFTSTGGFLFFNSPDAAVIPRTADAIWSAAWWGAGYVNSWNMNVGAYFAQTTGGLTDLSLFGGSPLFNGDDAELAHARYYGSPGLTCQGVACSIPVNTRTGAMQFEVPDLVLPSRGFNLAWVRTYSNFRPVNSSLGQGWTGNYAMFLQRLPDGSFIFHHRTGDTHVYRRNADGSFVSPPGGRDLATEAADGAITLRALTGEHLAFDAEGHLVEVGDRNGNVQRLSYQAGQVVAVRDATGQFLAIAYDASRRVAAVRDSAGREVTYRYNDLDQLVDVVRPGDERVAYTYAADHRLISWSDPRMAPGSKRGSLEYDGRGRVTRVFDGEGFLKHSLGYEEVADGTSRTTISETCCGPRIDEYDQRGLLTAQVDADGHRTETEFDADRRLVRRRDRNGNETRVVYNAQGRPTQVTDALGRVTRYEYEPVFGHMTAVVDPLSRRTGFFYDTQGNMIRSLDPAGGTMTAAYDGLGQRRSTTDANGHTARMDFDDVGNGVRQADALERATTFEWDARHRLTRRVDAKQRATRYGYNERDLRTETVFADGATTRSVFDEFNRLVEVSDALNHTTRTAYEKTDRSVSVTDPAGGITRYAYDVQGNLLSVEDANHHVTNYEYDHLNRLKKITDAIGKTQKSFYDPEGNRIERIDGNGVRTTFTFDVLNRLVSRNFPDGSTETFTFDAAGQLTRARNAAADIRYTYDALRRVTEHRYANLDKGFLHQYDPAGNRTHLTYPDGQTITYSYNAANEQVSAVDSEAGTFGLEYDETGMRTLLAYPNGLSTHSTYDARDRVLSLITTGEKTQLPDAQAPNFLYTYDPSGNRLSMDRSDEGLTTYSYDLKDQLTKAQFPKGAFQEFSYDPVGNRLKLQEIEHDSQLHTTDYTYNDANELLSLTRDFQDPAGGPGLADCPSEPAPDLLAGPGAPPSRWTTTFSYDGNGSRAAKAPDTGTTTTYAWDPQERLLAVLEGKSIVQTNTYDPFARRTSLTVNGATTAVLADATRSMNAALYEFTPGAKSPAPTRRLWVGNRLYASVTANQPEFLLCDALGSVAATSLATAALPSHIFYKPFGESTARGGVTGPNADPRFVAGTGVRADEHTGLLYMWNRYQDPSLGAFVSVDPYRRRSLVQTSYTYASNNPITRVDESGLLDTISDTISKAAATGDISTLEAMAANEELDLAYREMAKNAIQKLKLTTSTGAPGAPPPCPASPMEECVKNCAKFKSALVKAACTAICWISSGLF